MMFKILLSYLFILPALLAAKDYDCAVIGTSPVSLLEALYQSAAGKSVLVLEKDTRCGGAWQAIDVCGVAHVDLGCHFIGGTAAIADFLTRLGCKVVSMSEPSSAYQATNAPLGLYFSEGCYELISALEAQIRSSPIDLHLGRALKNVTFEKGWALLESSQGEIDRVKKIYHTTASRFSIQGQSLSEHSVKYYHLYLLIADGGAVRCSYRGGFTGVSRIMNLTPFAGLSASSLQLIALQVLSDMDLTKGESFLESLKTSALIDTSARLIREEPYIYEQYYCNGLTNNLTTEQKCFFEILDTSHLGNSLQRYLERWNALLFKR